MSCLRKIIIKNHGRYYPDDMKNIKDLDFDKFLVYVRPYQNNIIYRVAYKIPHSVHISFDAVNVYIEKRGRNQNLSLFHPNEKYERMFNGIKCLISQKSNNSDNYYHNYMKIGINSDDNLPLQKI